MDMGAFLEMSLPSFGFMFSGSWFNNQCSWLLVLIYWFLIIDSRLLVLNYWLSVIGSRLLVLEFQFSIYGS